jgi:tetratricopeptide (TPR) repeat protein
MRFTQGLTTALLGVTIVMVQPYITQALTLNQIQDIAGKITVRIFGSSDSGSGVIIAKSGNTYTVLTARHVIDGTGKGEEAYLMTHDGQEHDINTNKIIKLPNQIDLALIEFSSSQFYPVATISSYQERLYKNRDYTNPNYASLATQSSAKKYDTPVFVAGFPLEEKKLVFNPGFLYDNSASAISSPDVTNPEQNFRGYELIYTNLTHPGMSGGPVLDGNGRLIGIHGRADGKALDDNDQIEAEFLNELGVAKVKVGLSLAVPINTFLAWVKESNTNLSLKVENSPSAAVSLQELNQWTPPVTIENKNNPLYWINLGNQLWRLNRNQEAIAAFDQAIKLKANFTLAWFSKGFALGFNRDYQGALDACNQALLINPNDYYALRCKAGALQELQRFDGALTALNKALSINGNNPADWAAQGELLAGLKQYRGALESFNKAIELRKKLVLPESVGLLTNKGFVLLLMGENQQALTVFNQVINLDQSYPPAWNNKGLVLSNLKQNQEALQAYNKAVELDPNYVNAWNNRGMTLYDMGQYQEALASFEKALSINPNYQPAMQNRNALREQIGR